MHNIFVKEILSAFPDARSADTASLQITNPSQNLPSWFEVTELALASTAAAVFRLTEYAQIGHPEVIVDSRLASLWFDMTIRPVGWELPPLWDPIAGDYRTSDGWIRLHTNAPHHRDAALSVTGQYTDRESLAPAIEKWRAAELEAAIVEAGGCAAEMRSLDAWAKHPQGMASASEPLIHWEEYESVALIGCDVNPARPLSGVKVLDLTRILAGPVGGRFLAAYGANILRIDPLDWDEPVAAPEVTLGKRCAGLNLKDPEDRTTFEKLLAEADVLLHGYRPDALIRLGYDPESLRKINPRLVDVTLCAYGWSGPWKHRRGFDSLVQMSSGIADYGMRMSGAEKPVPLPVQALDHATGYLMAAALIHALNRRRVAGQVLSGRLSLASTARLLCRSKRTSLSEAMPVWAEQDVNPVIENTTWGPARRINFPVKIEGMPHFWDYPASALKSSEAVW